MIGLKGIRAENYAGTTSPLARRLRLMSPLERREEARAFLELYARETGQSDTARAARQAEVNRALRRFGTYEHTPEELAFGARVAWRNHARCIGRLFWESLEVVDCRALTTPDEIAERMVQHMDDAYGDGRIRSLISIFAPLTPDGPPAYIESAQISQYAGYVQDGGKVLGDRQNVEATRIALAQGFQPPAVPTAFDLLPVMIRDRQDRRAIYQMPPGTTREIAIRHPDCDAIGALGLKWYAVPVVSGMILTIGGVDYPCAPFNGFYMCTEIASRNFADKKRYNVLPDVARALALDPDAPGTPFWRDQALTELNRAVLQSYTAAGVTMLDHHAASDQFMEFHLREQASGRRVAANWDWIVPPQASAGCEVFHLPMHDFAPVPNYYHSRAGDGHRMMPFYGDLHRNRWQRNADRARRRLKLWQRSAW